MGAWRHPHAYSGTTMNFNQVLDLTKIAERGKFDLVFLADGNGVRNLTNPELMAAMTPTDRPAVFEPVALLSALAIHTQRIGLVATATTTYESPYLLARKFATLDHLSGGRSGWNVVTTSSPEDALNFSRGEHVAKDLRYQRAIEFVTVAKGLWDSWADDAFTENKASGQFLDPTRVHVLEHKGSHFSVRGPLNVARCPQGRPVLFSAGQSEDGRELAAAHSDCVFAVTSTLESVLSLSEDLRARLEKHGRHRRDLRIIPGASIIVGRTAEEADEFYEELGSLISPALGIDYLSKAVSKDLSGYDLDAPFPELDPAELLGINSIRVEISRLARKNSMTIRQTYQHVIPSSGHVIFKGSPTQVADQMEDWYRTKACDGFLVDFPVAPRDLQNFVDLVVPELQRRGLFRTEYAGRTLRETMGLPAVTNQFF